ncbi:MAG: ABC-F family ATP-binding cassette domain-containing protein, partial [Acidobacteria bacterium]|nr:ABC-F family ATP-binding cassette domain-containing protein [Acidobacteriota bacterium]
KIVEFLNVSKSYGDRKLIKDFTYFLKRGDRIGIIGANGAGKTTLLEILTKRAEPDAGEIAIGQTVHIGYYDQESRALNEDQRVIDYIRETAEYVSTADGTQITASQMLEKFLFQPAAQYSFIRNLSGGERRRLYLLKILMGAPNVLLLDEPTNDLDIPTLIALEEYLDDFPGALVVVSHDRYFLDRTIENIFKFEQGGEIREFPGDYSAYLEITERESKEAESPKTEMRATTNVQISEVENVVAKKLSFKEQRELETLEKEISENEKRAAEIVNELNLYATDSYKLNEIFGEQQRLNERLERDVQRWSELAERGDI